MSSNTIPVTFKNGRHECWGRGMLYIYSYKEHDITISSKFDSLHISRLHGGIYFQRIVICVIMYLYICKCIDIIQQMAALFICLVSRKRKQSDEKEESGNCWLSYIFQMSGLLFPYTNFGKVELVWQGLFLFLLGRQSRHSDSVSSSINYIAIRITKLASHVSLLSLVIVVIFLCKNWKNVNMQVVLYAVSCMHLFLTYNNTHAVCTLYYLTNTGLENSSVHSVFWCKLHP